MRVILIRALEVEIPEPRSWQDPVQQAEYQLDLFREKVLPSMVHGITIFKPTMDEPEQSELGTWTTKVYVNAEVIG